MLQSIIEKLKNLITNGSANPLTTGTAGGLLAGAGIEFLKSVDHDPATITDWKVFGALMAGAAFALIVRDPSAKKPDDTPPTP